MITCTAEFVLAVSRDLATWRSRHGPIRPWFRGESGGNAPLLPRIGDYSAEEENHLLQSFRRKAGGIANTPPFDRTDMWLFLAQHYGVPTRLLDWTEGALVGLYFAVNRREPNPRVYMLDPHRLNELATGQRSDRRNFPLTWQAWGYGYIALAWQMRQVDGLYRFPIAVPATYQDHRMIAQRSCFTIHGTALQPLPELLRAEGVDQTDCIIEYHIDSDATTQMLEDLAVLGVTGSTIFPDLDHVARDIASELGHREALGRR